MLEDGGESGEVCISGYPKCFSHVVRIELVEQNGPREQSW